MKSGEWAICKICVSSLTALFFDYYNAAIIIIFPCMCIPADTRSPIPVIPVHSVGNLQYMWQS